MGVSCQIFRDRNGSIERVETPDGRPSALYQEALAYTQNEKEALDLWTVNYLTEFRESMIPFDIKRTEPQFQIIGEVGANNIPMYKATLESAKRLEAAGRSPEDIEQNTKWYKSNGQWKRLSPETVAQFKINRNPINQELTLKEVIGDGSILFQIYPQLGDTKVVFYDLNREGAPTNLPKDAEGALGMYIQKNGTVYVNTDFKGQRRVDSEQTYTLAHELSHRIQDIEGFPNGGGPFSLVAEAYNILSVEENTNLQKLEQLIKDSDKSNLTSNEKKILKDALVAIDAIKTGNQQVLQNQYRHLMGEIDAKMVEGALKIRDNQGTITTSYKELFDFYLQNFNIDPSNIYLLRNGDVRFSLGASPTAQTLINQLSETGVAQNVHQLNTTEIQERAAELTETEQTAPQFQIISEKGAQAIEDYNNRLNRAKELESQGVEYSDISDQTGWYKFQDDWRFFSNEALRQFDINEENIKENETQNITEILDPENILFKMYPSLLDYKVKFNTYEIPSQESANHNKDTRTINLYNIHGRRRKATFAHELSHAIQHVEGLPRGGGLSSFLGGHLQRNRILKANQEATLDQILDYVEAVNAAEVGSLNQIEVQEVKGMLRTLGVPNSEVFAREISRVFTHGNLNENFNSSEMFSEFDKEVIRANQEYQNNLRELGHKINNTEETVYNNESFEEDFLLYDGTTNSYGIGVSQNPLIVEENIRQQVGGISDRDSFDSAFNEIQYESIVDQFNSDEAFAQRMFDKFSTLTRVSSFTLENGALTETQEINKTKTVENTADLDRTNLSEDIQFLSQIPVEVWEVSGTEIQQGLDQIEDKAETAGMDFNGLKQSYGSKTRTQILNFLTTVNNVEKQPTPENFEAFLEAYSEFFEVDSTPKVQVEDISSENASKTLVGVENPSSEYDMFNTHSLVKVDNNLYQRVNKVPLETMYEIFYSEVLVNDNRMLPDAAYRMSNTELKKPENKVFAINNIEIFLQNNIGQLELGTTIFDTDTVQQLLAYKYYYGNPMTVEAVDNMAEDMTAIQDFDGNSQYLTTEYHTDFQVAKMKAEGTAKYNSVYSKLHIGDNGIVPINTDSISMEQLRAGIQEDLTAKERKDLKNYTVVSKNRDMKTLFPREDSQFTIPSKPQERQYYRNNPKALNDFTGKYRTFEGGLVTTDTGADFIRVGDRLYERTQGVADSSFYREILTVDSNFNMIENDVKAINKFEHNDIIPYLRTSETVEKTNNIYTKKELAEIDQSKFDCA